MYNIKKTKKNTTFHSNAAKKKKHSYIWKRNQAWDNNLYSLPQLVQRQCIDSSFTVSHHLQSKYDKTHRIWKKNGIKTKKKCGPANNMTIKYLQVEVQQPDPSHMCGFGLVSLLKAIMGHLYKPATNGFMLYVWRPLTSTSCSPWQPE